MRIRTRGNSSSTASTSPYEPLTRKPDSQYSRKRIRRRTTCSRWWTRCSEIPRVARMPGSSDSAKRTRNHTSCTKQKTPRMPPQLSASSRRNMPTACSMSCHTSDSLGRTVRISPYPKNRIARNPGHHFCTHIRTTRIPPLRHCTVKRIRSRRTRGNRRSNHSHTTRSCAPRAHMWIWQACCSSDIHRKPRSIHIHTTCSFCSTPCSSPSMSLPCIADTGLRTHSHTNCSPERLPHTSRCCAATRTTGNQPHSLCTRCHTTCSHAST
jgi:hypothetical protein